MAETRFKLGQFSSRVYTPDHHTIQLPLCADTLLLLRLFAMALRTTAAFWVHPHQNLGGTDRLQNTHHTPLWPGSNIRGAQELFQFSENPTRLEQRCERSQALHIQEAPVSMTGSPGPLFWPEVLWWGEKAPLIWSHKFPSEETLLLPLHEVPRDHLYQLILQLQQCFAANRAPGTFKDGLEPRELRADPLWENRKPAPLPPDRANPEV